ncbi:MAG: hypothetical protein NW207_03905 [Cytophagales bacterium]|nr:hypothetical protein [Cytophagales bacterium]
MAELTYERVLELFAETDRRMAETDKQMAETNRQMAERDKRMEKSQKELNKKLAEFGDMLGKYAEEQVREDLIRKFNDWNIPVHFIANHCVMKDDNLEFVYEIDILLYNKNYVVAIEVKNTLKKDDIDEHIERMAKILAHPMSFAEGKILLAAVAGMIVSDGVDKYAESKGLFVIKPSGDNVKIMNNQTTFRPREWKVK